MVYRTRAPSHRSRRPRQLSDDELHSLEEGTSSGSSGSQREREGRRLVMHSEGKKRHGKFRRGLHKVHKRVRDAKGKGREVVSCSAKREHCLGSSRR